MQMRAEVNIMLPQGIEADLIYQMLWLWLSVEGGEIRSIL